VKVWDRWKRVLSHLDPRSYLYRTAFNVHRSHYRRGVRAARHLVGAARWPMRAWAVPTRTREGRRRVLWPKGIPASF
jgi:hypothetical protein